jgi:hypothetical protein
MPRKLTKHDAPPTPDADDADDAPGAEPLALCDLSEDQRAALGALADPAGLTVEQLQASLGPDASADAALVWLANKGLVSRPDAEARERGRLTGAPVYWRVSVAGYTLLGPHAATAARGGLYDRRRPPRAAALAAEVDAVVRAGGSPWEAQRVLRAYGSRLRERLPFAARVRYERGADHLATVFAVDIDPLIEAAAGATLCGLALPRAAPDVTAERGPACAGCLRAAERIADALDAARADRQAKRPRRRKRADAPDATTLDAAAAAPEGGAR